MYSKAILKDIFKITELYTAFLHTYEEDYSFVGETHNFWELVLVLDGQIGVTAGSDVLILNKGQAILHYPMEFHRLWSEKGSSPTIVIISFNCKNMPKIKSRVFEINEFLSTESKSIIRLIKQSFITGMVNVKKIKNPDSIKHHLTLKKLELFILNVISQNVNKINTINSSAAELYSQIIEYMEKNIEKNLTVSFLADKFNISEPGIKKIFKKYSGIGVKTYFNNLKMNEALVLLQSGMSVTEVSLSLGFSDPNYFSAAFKNKMGYSPSKYKK